MSDLDAIPDLDERHALRDYWQRTTRLEADTLNAVRMGDRLAHDAAVRSIANAVIDLPASNRGLAVTGVLVDADAGHACWLVLIELDGGNRTAALSIPYPM